MDRSHSFFSSISHLYGVSWTIEEENRAALRRFFPADFQGRVLEVGCGNGRALENLPPGTVGVDYCEKMLDEAARRLTLKGSRALLVRAEGRRLPFRAGAFTVIVTVNALHNQDAPDEWLAEIRRLHPARWICDFRNILNPATAWKKWRYGEMVKRKVGISYDTWTMRGFKKSLAKAGFRMTRSIPVERPVSEPASGFRFRNLALFFISRIPGLTPGYVTEVVVR